MLELELLIDAQRQLSVCNACRYCEGLCAVFPALEHRSVFGEADVAYLANLCHDCRACLYVCPFAPPHEFAVNVPKVMTQVRERVYASYIWPSWLASKLVGRIGFALGLCGLLAAAALGATIAGSSIDRLLEVRTGPGAFYQVLPWLVMAIPALVISVYGLALMLLGGIRFWQDSATTEWPLTFAFGVRTAWEAITLKYLRGGGGGCSYPAESPSPLRRSMHILVFAGFGMAFASTVVAAIYQDFLGQLPPYSVSSPPVVLGVLGGVTMIVGCTGFLLLGRRADPLPTTRATRTMDVAFIAVLLLTSITGMAVLVLRETSAMAILLDVHLGFVAGLLITLPYGKFVHAVFRSAALLRNKVEQRHY
jgi:citrate/tricarballylate utilization protein